MKVPILTVVIVLLTSCASSRMTSSNFHEKVRVNTFGKNLFSGKNIDNRTDCFPNNIQKICKNLTYKENENVDAQIFDIQVVTDPEDKSDDVSSFMSITAAEITKKYNFKYFTTIRYKSVQTCQKTYHKKTKGLIQANTLTTRTRYSTKNHCSNFIVNTIIAYNDPEITHIGIFQKQRKKISPLHRLYRTVYTNTVFPEIFNMKAGKDTFSSLNLSSYISSSDWGAWKKAYKAEKIIELSTKKYSLNGKRTYQITDYSIKKKVKKEKSILEEAQISTEEPLGVLAGQKKDISEVKMFYTKACKEGVKVATFDLPQCKNKKAAQYYSSAKKNGQAGNFKKSISLYLKSCKSGSARACYKIALSKHHLGLKSEATTFYSLSCKYGLGTGCFAYQLSKFRKKEIPVIEEKLIAEASIALHQGCYYGSGRDCRELGRINKAKPQVAKSWFKQGCNGNDYESCFQLVQILSKYDRIEASKVYKQAMEDLQIGCENKNAEDCYLLGDMFRSNKPKLSESLLKTSCQYGSIPGCARTKK